jgi:hypothetical protein
MMFFCIFLRPQLVPVLLWGAARRSSAIDLGGGYLGQRRRRNAKRQLGFSGLSWVEGFVRRKVVRKWVTHLWTGINRRIFMTWANPSNLAKLFFGGMGVWTTCRPPPSCLVRAGTAPEATGEKPEAPEPVAEKEGTQTWPHPKGEISRLHHGCLMINKYGTHWSKYIQVVWWV